MYSWFLSFLVYSFNLTALHVNALFEIHVVYVFIFLPDI